MSASFVSYQYSCSEVKRDKIDYYEMVKILTSAARVDWKIDLSYTHLSHFFREILLSSDKTL